MINVKTSGEKGCWELHNFPATSDPHAHGSWDESKNTYPLRNHVILNEVTTQPVASWILGPNNGLTGNCDFLTGMNSYYMTAYHFLRDTAVHCYI